MTQPKPYIEYSDFPKLTPFTEQAAKNAVARRELREGVHYFKRGRRVIFKWQAIEAWIEGRFVGPMTGREMDDAADLAPVRKRA